MTVPIDDVDVPSKTSEKKRKVAVIDNGVHVSPSSAEDEPPAKRTARLCLSGMVFCITGRTPTVRRDLVALIEANGGEVVQSVTNRCTHLIAADAGGYKKENSAAARQTEVIDEAKLRSMISSDPGGLRQLSTCSTLQRRDIADGQVVTVEGTPYILKFIGGVFSCSCPAWKNQKTPINYRTCKHLKDYRGPDVEDERVSGALLAVHAEHSTGSGKSKEPKLLLANKWDGTKDVIGWWMSEKFDGMRAYYNGKNEMISRLGNKVRTIRVKKLRLLLMP